jgi:glutamyl-tRNA reductase
MPFLVGLSHRSAPLELREKVAIGAARLPEALTQVREAANLEEVVLLSTCNRTEIYGRSNDDRSALAAVASALERWSGTASLGEHLYHRENGETVAHLFRVAAGLDSMVQGENEILGQVKEAYLTAQRHGHTGKLFNVLFQRGLFVGKKVRSETGVSIGSGSVASVAVGMAERIFGDLCDRTVMILGAGEMAEQAAKHLLSQKIRSLIVSNRTYDRAVELARQYAGTALSFDEGLARMAEADIVICSTAAPHPVIHAEHVRSVMASRRGRSLFFIDIAVPRDVDPTVHDLDNVYLYNLDDLQKIVRENLTRRDAEMRRAEQIVHLETDQFVRWLAAHRSGQRQSLKHGSSLRQNLSTE